jgi:hypothetical protein
MSPDKSSGTARCVTGPTDLDRELLYSSAPSYWGTYQGLRARTSHFIQQFHFFMYDGAEIPIHTRTTTLLPAHTQHNKREWSHLAE